MTAKDFNDLRHALTCVLGQDSVRNGAFAILYGSAKPDRDLDVMVLDPGFTPAAAVTIGRLDAFVLPYARFRSLLRVLDLVVSEPVLNGRVIIGEEAEWERIARETRGTPAGSDAVLHSAGRSCEEFVKSLALWREYSDTNNQSLLHWLLHSLSFAASYLSFARHYAEPNAYPCTLEELKNSGRLLLPEFWPYWESVKSTRTVGASDVEQWLLRWSNVLAANCGPRANGSGV